MQASLVTMSPTLWTFMMRCNHQHHHNCCHRHSHHNRHHDHHNCHDDQVATIARPPVDPAHKRPTTEFTGYIICIYQVSLSLSIFGIKIWRGYLVDIICIYQVFISFASTRCPPPHIFIPQLGPKYTSGLNKGQEPSAGVWVNNCGQDRTRSLILDVLMRHNFSSSIFLQVG